MKNNVVSHDSIFKTVFEDVNAVIEFITRFIPANIAALINLKNLKRDSESYLTKSMQKQYADIVYRTTINGVNTALVLLFEHKFDKRGILPLQILKYMIRIWEIDFKNGRPFSIIIPIVIYHADKVTEKRPLSSYFEFRNEITDAFIPDFNFLFLNVKKEEDKILLDLSDKTALKGLFLAFKHIKQSKMIIRYFSEMARFGAVNEKLSEQFFQFMLYLRSNTDIKSEVFDDILESQSEEEIKHIVMTSAQELMTKGRIQGKADNQVEIVRNGWEEGFTVAQIAKITKLPSDKIKELIAQFETEAKLKN